MTTGVCNYAPACNASQIEATECMGPRLRGDDEVRVARMERSEIRDRAGCDAVAQIVTTRRMGPGLRQDDERSSLRRANGSGLWPAR